MIWAIPLVKNPKIMNMSSNLSFNAKQKKITLKPIYSTITHLFLFEKLTHRNLKCSALILLLMAGNKNVHKITLEAPKIKIDTKRQDDAIDDHFKYLIFF